ncbi:MAG: glycosyltransferase family 2 protein [Burkholderiales bacterium]
MTELLEPVSVIVVNHNAGELLLECVAVALQQAQEVIVVDNHSTDASMTALAAQFQSEPRIKVIYLSENQGFAAGCNKGIEAATRPHFLFINPDTIVEAGSLRRLVQVLDSDASIGMVGGLLTNPDGSEQGGGRRAVPTPWRSFVRAFGLNRLSAWWPKLFFDFYLHKQPLPSEPIEVEAISGALMLVRRDAVTDVGLWDDAYFLHCEDLDWCMRFRQKGWRIVFVPDAPVLHYQGHSSRARPLFVEWHKHKGMVRFYRKFFSHQYPGVLMWLVAAAVWVRFSALFAGYWIKRIVARLQAWSE